MASFMELYGVRTFGELTSEQKREVMRKSIAVIGPRIAARAEAITGGLVQITFVESDS
jgi:hypothetical protein